MGYFHCPPFYSYTICSDLFFFLLFFPNFVANEKLANFNTNYIIMELIYRNSFALNLSIGHFCVYSIQSVSVFIDLLHLHTNFGSTIYIEFFFTRLKCLLFIFNIQYSYYNIQINIHISTCTTIIISKYN